MNNISFDTITFDIIFLIAGITAIIRRKKLAKQAREHALKVDKFFHVPFSGEPPSERANEIACLIAGIVFTIEALISLLKHINH